MRIGEFFNYVHGKGGAEEYEPILDSDSRHESYITLLPDVEKTSKLSR